MALSELKKNRDSSTAYGKRVYADPKYAAISANIPKTILKVIHNCFESKLTKPGTALPLFDDKLIAQITDLSTKTIRHLRKEYTSQNEDISPKPITHNIGAIDF